MDLKSDALFWPRLSRTPTTHGPLRQNLHCDVAVIGAGLSGAMIAHALSDEGLDVVILDKRGVGHGSTSASTAVVLYEIDTPLIELARQRGRAAAVKTYRRCLDAIAELAALVRQLKSPCGFRRRQSLYLASRPTELGTLKQEFAARKRAGLDVQFLTRPDVEKWFSFSAPGAIYSADAAEVDPFRLTTLLIKAARRQGARVFVRTEATNVSESQHGVIVHTSAGHRVTARWVVVAAGFESAAKAARRVVRLKSSYALATRPVNAFPGWHQRCLIWETKRPYLYLRTTADDRIMIGGEDEDFIDARKRDRLIRTKCTVLTRKLRQLFPDIPVEPACAWAGTFGETKDGLPYIGPLKPGSRVLYALCYGANGTNFAVIAADIIRNSILQKRNAYARLFEFGR